jgi:hypothetical protein
MEKYKIGDKVNINGEIIEVDESFKTCRVEIGTNNAYGVWLSMKNLTPISSDEKWRQKIEDSKLPERHTEDCENHECNCGFFERQIYNKALNDLLT